MRKWAVAGGLALAILVAAAFIARGCDEPRPQARAVVRPEPAPAPPEEPGPPVAPPPAPPPAAVRVVPTPPPPPPAPVQAAGTGAVIGTVRLAGKAPPRRRIRMEADPKCAARHESPPPADDLVVDRENRLCWAFVYVKSGLNNRRFPAPATPVVLDQFGCRYEPHVFGILTGQRLVVRNSDNLLHNVHFLGTANRERNFGQPEAGMEETVGFTAPEVMVPIRCDIHPWMAAWAGVLDHPFFAVTDELGGYAITGLPAGRYRIAAWHERTAPDACELDVPEGGQVAADFLLQLKSDSR